VSLTLKQVRDKADAKLATLWLDVIRPGELAWFAGHGEYAQVLYTRNLPENWEDSEVVQELLPITNIEPDDRPGMTARAVFGAVNIDVSLPFALATHVYNGPNGHGFVGQVWAKYEGDIYTRARNYGAETWRTLDWHRITAGPE
jgi:hypothetical protein